MNFHIFQRRPIERKEGNHTHYADEHGLFVNSKMRNFVRESLPGKRDFALSVSVEDTSASFVSKKAYRELVASSLTRVNNRVTTRDNKNPMT